MYYSPNTSVDHDVQKGLLVMQNYGKVSDSFVYALEVEIIEDEDELTIIQNPGLSQN
ncbi:MAG: hypothetical protein WAT79_16925 [Saprospiraceae bacterium]